jgi:hypothetical protein
MAIKNTDQLASLLIDPFYIFGQFFSDLASENTEILASLASVLKNLSTTLQNTFGCGM